MVAFPRNFVRVFPVTDDQVAFLILMHAWERIGPCGLTKDHQGCYKRHVSQPCSYMHQRSIVVWAMFLVAGMRGCHQ